MQAASRSPIARSGDQTESRDNFHIFHIELIPNFFLRRVKMDL